VVSLRSFTTKTAPLHSASDIGVMWGIDRKHIYIVTSAFLTIAGSLSFVAALLHICVVIGGPRWYRFFGAGEAIAQLAEIKSLKPTIITLGISAILFTWAAFAWSASGHLPSLPFTKFALSAITIIYLIRGAAGVLAPFVSDHPLIKQNSVAFWIWSSAVCVMIGLFHLIGLIEVWRNI